MHASHVEHHASVRLDDVLECCVRVRRPGRTGLTYEVAALSLEDEMVLVTGTQTLVLIEVATRRPVPLPNSFRQTVRSLEQEHVAG